MIVFETDPLHFRAADFPQRGGRQRTLRNNDFTVGHLLLRLHGVAGVGKEYAPAIAKQQQRAVAAGEPGQVANVVRISDVERVRRAGFRPVPAMLLRGRGDSAHRPFKEPAGLYPPSCAPSRSMWAWAALARG